MEALKWDRVEKIDISLLFALAAATTAAAITVAGYCCVLLLLLLLLFPTSCMYDAEHYCCPVQVIYCMYDATVAAATIDRALSRSLRSIDRSTLRSISPSLPPPPRWHSIALCYPPG